MPFADPDPFSGEPYRVNREKMVHLQHRRDRKDNGGTEQVNYLRDSDIAVPYSFSPPADGRDSVTPRILRFPSPAGSRISRTAPAVSVGSEERLP